MKIYVSLAAVAASLVIACSSSTANAGAVLDGVLATKTLRVAVGTDWGTISFLNDKHELDGSDVDVAKAIAQKLGVKVQFVTPAWDIITSGKWEGRWDVAMGEMVPTKARAEKLSFPALYAYGAAVAVVHKDSKAAKLSDLEGKIVGVTASSSNENYANHTLTPDWEGAKPIEYKFTPGEVKTYGTDSVALDDLRLGDGVRLHAVLTDRSVVQSAIKAGYPLKELSEPLFFTTSAIVILPGDKEFSDKIAATIKKMRDDGTLSKIMIKWYSVDRSIAQ
ncbi:transporter substrate-binding domain-containing protein [Mesorhizobium sp.]|uniref:transporter substrate-binding domain-containing protein n=1 Tax=Mesorhizobium sp. TaxID=1871066 RepID=UPI000FD1D757|nr:transporter substrate-binding domain-containing protein [Mesorhizobium sp.]RVC56094.1 transporter substrate-binding domain-containing protein [Mesorhizobium sp. M4B.F.Ca.ET.088.02.2.1]RVD74275.1 transporter substrate-binding domain-containing protein [Mesorhizobium sp. M4A.F.Ca.ET.029.04.2.1]RWF25270.1 MAG: transporter substrate-binding domain-containing protein [Mesorhizobium sp.]RWL02836.1 MAG: transporter substrate-binding domain-containing protein [Mesorhizobium sp.]